MNKKIKIKDSIYVLKETEEKYIFISTATRRIKKFKIDSLVKDVIDFLDSEKEESNLVKQLSKKYQTEKIYSCLDALEYEGIIRRYNADFKKDRYYKQLLFIDELTSSRSETLRLQQRLENSKIAIFGVGRIGTWMVNSLYQIGIGEIRIVDPDIIDETNLNRQLFFTKEDIGKYKVDVIKRRLNNANIITFKETLKEGVNLEKIISGCNFIINCADSPSIPETTKIVDKFATQHNIPYCVSGGYNLHLGMIGPIIIPGVTKTFDDFIEYQKRMDPLKDLKKIKDINETGNIGPIAGAIANIQAMEIFKFLIGKGKLNLNKFAEINFMDLTIEWREF